jgi:signal transduction histidine kinase
MLTRSKDSQTDKAKRTMQDVVRYAQQVARDEGLRADVSAALAHGSKAGDQLKKDIQAGGIYSRLAADKKLRKHLRAMLDDLDAASDRVRRKSHRLRNFVLMLAGLAAAALALPKIRPWLTKRTEDFTNEPDSLT